MSQEEMNLKTETLMNADQKETDLYKCPSCGNDMKFSPETQTLRCDHCGTERTFEKDEFLIERNLQEMLSINDSWSKEAIVFRCDNCGAKEVLNRSEIAVRCPYCGATNIVETDELSGHKPDGVLPFSVSKDGALEKFRAWVKKRFFVPKKCKKNLDVEGVRGVYSPCWTFDTHAVSTYEGRVGKYYTVTVGSGKNRRTERRIRWYYISGEIERRFDDILISAGPKANETPVAKVSPFDTNNATVYTNEFLAGFSANHYEKGVDDAWREAESIISEQLKRDIKSKHNADVVDYIKQRIKHCSPSCKYVLLPIWVGAMGYRKNTYNFYVNGNTGKVWGKMPVSPLRVGLVVVLSLAVVVGLMLLFHYYG